MLQSEGYIRGYTVTDFGNGRSEFEIELKYYDGAPVIREIARVSKPGRRVYVVGEDISRASTMASACRSSRRPRGVMADHEARDANVGGEVICTVF